MREPNRGVRLIGEVDDQKTFDTIYGAFTLRRPSLFMQREIHKEAARALEGLTNVDSVGEMQNLAMVTINVCARADGQRATDAPRGFPQGFNWNKAYDFEFLTVLYSEFSKWVSSFRRPQDADADKAGSGGPSEKQGVPTEETVQLGSSQSGTPSAQ